jgi:putative oxidoreductase
MEVGLFLIRMVVGLTFVAHGSQKLFGLFGGDGLKGTGAMFESLGFHPGRPFAMLAGLGELLGGLGLALGLFTPFASAIIIAVMMVAIVTVHVGKGFFAPDGGFEYPLTLATVALGVAFAGPGRFSCDSALGLPFASVRWGLFSLVLGAIGALVPLIARATMRRGAATA